ncbi:MAG: hypothetical protein ACYC1Q_09155 [Bacteroidia bacterium]
MDDAKQLFKDQLSGKEQILWASVPLQGLRLRKSDKYMIPFSLLWCATVVIWEWFALGMGELGTTMAWFGVPFMLIGLYLLVGRFYMDAFIRRNTFYALTSKKILVKTGRWNSSVDQFLLKSIKRITVEQGKGESGTLRCYDERNALILQLEMVPEMLRLADLIQKTKTTPHESTTTKR